MNAPSLSVDYGFPDLTEKSGPIEDTGQSREGASLPSPLPKMSLVEPPWHVVPGEEEEEEQLLPVTRSQEEPQSQVHGFPPTSSSQTPGAPEHRHEESGDQASSGVEVGSSVEPSLSPPTVTPSPVALGGQDVADWGAGGTGLPAAGHGLELEAPREPSEEATAGTAGLAGQPGEGPSPASFPQTEAPSGAEASDEDPTHPGASASFSLAPGDTELTPSSAAVGRETLSQLPQEGQTADAPSRTPWDSTQVSEGARGLPGRAQLAAWGGLCRAPGRWVGPGQNFGGTARGPAVGVLSTLRCTGSAPPPSRHGFGCPLLVPAAEGGCWQRSGQPHLHAPHHCAVAPALLLTRPPRHQKERRGPRWSAVHLAHRRATVCP